MTILPWRRSAAHAQQRLAEAEMRREHTRAVVDRAREASAQLNREVRKNGWTELFTLAMKGR